MDTATQTAGKAKTNPGKKTAATTKTGVPGYYYSIPMPLLGGETFEQASKRLMDEFKGAVAVRLATGGDRVVTVPVAEVLMPSKLSTRDLSVLLNMPNLLQGSISITYWDPRFKKFNQAALNEYIGKGLIEGRQKLVDGQNDKRIVSESDADGSPANDSDLGVGVVKRAQI